MIWILLLSLLSYSDGQFNWKKKIRMWIMKTMSHWLFSYLLQNLKVSSQTNFLSRAWWFPIFYFFEKNVQGSIPCCFSWPLSWPPGCFKSSCKKYSRVQKTGEDNEKSTWAAKRRQQLLYQKRYRCHQRCSFLFLFFILELTGKWRSGPNLGWMIRKVNKVLPFDCSF